MKKIIYNKLVRDRIPEVIEKSGEVYESRKLDETEFEVELFKKIQKEAAEIQPDLNKYELAKELADLLEVVNEIKSLKNISDEDITLARAANMAKKGGFEKRIYLEWTSDTGYKSGGK